MSDLDISALGLEDLRVEIGRLQQELTETNQEKIRAAEYGLAVLEERNRLESQIEELESNIHSLRIELDHAKEVCIVTAFASAPEQDGADNFDKIEANWVGLTFRPNSWICSQEMKQILEWIPLLQKNHPSLLMDCLHYVLTAVR